MKGRGDVAALDPVADVLVPGCRKHAERNRDDGHLRDRADSRRQRRAGDAEWRDQEKIAAEVQDVRDDHRGHERPRAAVRLQVRAGHEEQEKRQQRRRPDEKERARFAGQLRRADERDERCADDENDGQPRRHGDGEPDALPERAAGAVVIAGADRLRDQRVDAEDGADADDGEGEKDGVAEAGRGQLARAEAAEDRDVDEPHELRPGLREGDRAGQPEQLPQLAAVVGNTHLISVHSPRTGPTASATRRTHTRCRRG